MVVGACPTELWEFHAALHLSRGGPMNYVSDQPACLLSSLTERREVDRGRTIASDDEGAGSKRGVATAPDDCKSRTERDRKSERAKVQHRRGILNDPNVPQGPSVKEMTPARTSTHVHMQGERQRIKYRDARASVQR